MCRKRTLLSLGKIDGNLDTINTRLHGRVEELDLGLDILHAMLQTIDSHV